MVQSDSDAEQTRISAWTIVSVACAAAIVLAFGIGSFYHSHAMAQASALDESPPDAGGMAAVALMWLLASPIGVVAGILGWTRSPRSRWLAGAGVLACAAPWLLLFLAAKLDLVDSAPNCGCDELEAEE